MPKFKGYVDPDKKAKVSVLKTIFIMTSVLVLVIVAYQAILIPMNTNNVIQNVQKEDVTVYNLKHSVTQGHKIVDSDIEEVNINKTKVPKDAVISKNVLINKVAKFDLPAHMTLMPELITDDGNVIKQDIRLQEFFDIKLNTGLAAGKYVDVRIKLKDGSDYCVLSKKYVVSINGKSVFFNISDQERETYDKASKEAESSGAILYTIIYPDPLNQAATNVNYPV